METILRRCITEITVESNNNFINWSISVHYGWTKQTNKMKQTWRNKTCYVAKFIYLIFSEAWFGQVLSGFYYKDWLNIIKLCLLLWTVSSVLMRSYVHSKNTYYLNVSIMVCSMILVWVLYHSYKSIDPGVNFASIDW